MLMCQSGVHFPKPQLSQVPSTGLATIVANNVFGKHTLGRVILYVNVTIISKDQEICDFYLFSLNDLLYMASFEIHCNLCQYQWLECHSMAGHCSWMASSFSNIEKQKQKKQQKTDTQTKQVSTSCYIIRLIN